MENKNLNYYISKYFSEYLPIVKGVSHNTIISYKDTFIDLLQYCDKNKKINLKNISLTAINYEMIEDYLKYLEDEKNNSISTRNQRLASIHSFYQYLQKRELSCFDNCANIISIPYKKAPKKTLSYFSKEEIAILIKIPNTKEKNGFRHYVLLLFMYETAARAQEICDLTKKQIHIGDYNYIILKGKGNKERNVPISKNLSNILIKYMDVFKVVLSDDYVFKNKSSEKMTPKGIEYILKKYVAECKVKTPEKFNDNYSNHSMRHTRAMHLLESGVNLIYIRDILGHTSVVTTEIYARTNSKVKEKIIKEHSSSLDTKDKYSQKQKDDLLKFLKELK